MPKIAVCGLGELRQTLVDFRPDGVVTILSPAGPTLDIDVGRRLDLRFHDVALSSYGPSGKPYRLAMSPEHTRKLIAFAREPFDRLLIHCALGRSRSPAAAIVAHVANGVAPSVACEIIGRAVPEAQPNVRVINLADTQLGMDGELIAAVSRRWSRP